MRLNGEHANRTASGSQRISRFALFMPAIVLIEALQTDSHSVAEFSVESNRFESIEDSLCFGRPIGRMWSVNCPRTLDRSYHWIPRWNCQYACKLKNLQWRSSPFLSSAVCNFMKLNPMSFGVWCQFCRIAMAISILWWIHNFETSKIETNQAVQMEVSKERFLEMLSQKSSPA